MELISQLCIHLIGQLLPYSHLCVDNQHKEHNDYRQMLLCCSYIVLVIFCNSQIEVKVVVSF